MRSSWPPVRRFSTKARADAGDDVEATVYTSNCGAADRHEENKQTKTANHRQIAVNMNVSCVMPDAALDKKTGERRSRINGYLVPKILSLRVPESRNNVTLVIEALIDRRAIKFQHHRFPARIPPLAPRPARSP